MGSVVKSVGSVIGGAGKMLGIGAGNGPEFDPARFSYNPKEEAFKAQNGQQATDLNNIQKDASQRMQGIDEREARTKQTSLAAALEASANGQGPSLAQNQLRQATDRNLAQQLSLAAAARGNQNPALMQRQLMQNQAATNQVAAAQSGDLRLQEQQQARAQLADALNQQRGQDQQAYANQTGVQMNAIQGQQGINDANRSAQMDLEHLRGSIASGTQQAYAADVNSRRDAHNQVVGGLIKGVSGALTPKGAHGGIVQGKAKVPGDSPVNDTEEVVLAPEEIVLPRSVVKSENPGDAAKQFVEALAKKHPGKVGQSGEKGFGAILALEKRIEALESKKKKKD